MQHQTNRGRTDWANALRSRVLFVLLAIFALGATPLGVGDLLAAESYVGERNKHETRSGGLPNRFAVPCAEASAGEFLDPVPEPDSRVVLLTDTPGLHPPFSTAWLHEAGRHTGALRLEGTSPSLARAQGARAPPAG
jgi:hypothetical protein